MQFECACGRYRGPIAWCCAGCEAHVVMPALTCDGCGRAFGERPVVVWPVAACAECGREYEMNAHNRRYCDLHLATTTTRRTA